MLDLIQIKSWYKKLNFKEDIDFIDSLMQLRVYEPDYDKPKDEKFNFEKEAEYIISKAHTHLDLTALERITDSSINAWNIKAESAKRNISQYENDLYLINKSYVDEKFSNLNPASILIDCNVIVINGLNGKKWLLSISDDGVLSTNEYIQEGE